MNNDAKNMAPKEDDEKLLKEVMQLPPMTGNIAEDYITLLNKEMAAISAVWSEYQDGKAKDNVLISNHMNAVLSMYQDLLKVGDFAKSNPDYVEGMIKKVEEMQNDSNK